MGLTGPLVLLSDIDEISDTDSEHPTDAGGHPLPSAIAAIVIEEETPIRAPDLPRPTEVGDAPREIAPVEEVKPGPAVGEKKQVETARPRTATSDDVVILKFVRPVYPADALLLRSEGAVELHFQVDLAGNVVGVTSFPEEGIMPSMVDAAEKAAAQWRFKPLKNQGVSEWFWVKLTFRFVNGNVTATSPSRS